MTNDWKQHVPWFFHHFVQVLVFSMELVSSSIFNISIHHHITQFNEKLQLKLLYFEWSPPWHSCNFIWHTFWHSIWHIFWHSIWHSIWHTFWQSIWHIFWHSIWHSMWHSFWHSFWHSIWYSFWHSIWHSIWHIFWHLSWGPAVPTGLGRSLVEVQRYPLDLRGPRLRSSSAHCDQELARRGGEGEGGGGRRGELSQNLTTLTWQAEKKQLASSTIMAIDSQAPPKGPVCFCDWHSSLYRCYSLWKPAGFMMKQDPCRRFVMLTLTLIFPALVLWSFCRWTQLQEPRCLLATPPSRTAKHRLAAQSVLEAAFVTWKEWAPGVRLEPAIGWEENAFP